MQYLQLELCLFDKHLKYWSFFRSPTAPAWFIQVAQDHIGICLRRRNCSGLPTSPAHLQPTNGSIRKINGAKLEMVMEV